MIAVSSLAALMLPPGVICDRSTLDLILHADIVLTKSTTLLRAEGMPESEWLSTAVRRFRATLAGHDIHAVHDWVDDFGDSTQPI